MKLILNTTVHKLSDKLITYVTEVVSHTVYVLIKVALIYKVSKSILLKVRYSAGIEA